METNIAHVHTIAAAAVFALLGAMAPVAGAQAGRTQPAAQNQRHQQMQQQMQDMAQRMSRIHDRAHQLSQSMQQQMQQNQAQQGEHQRLMLRTCQATEETARQMREMAERAREMQQSREFQGDRDMQRDMDRLRQHMDTMAGDMENTLRIMERMQERLRQNPPR